MKRTCKILLPLRYIMWRPQGSEFSTILRVPDRQMQNFIRVASVKDDSVMFLGNKDFSNKIGKKVRILGGPFEGVTGTIYRVKKDRRVVITPRLTPHLSVAIPLLVKGQICEIHKICVT